MLKNGRRFLTRPGAHSRINFNSIWYCDQKYVGCGLANGLSGARSTSRRMVLRISVRDLRAL